jgi:hypothetical protein
VGARPAEVASLEGLSLLNGPPGFSRLPGVRISTGTPGQVANRTAIPLKPFLPPTIRGLSSTPLRLVSGVLDRDGDAADPVGRGVRGDGEGVAGLQVVLDDDLHVPRRVRRDDGEIAGRLGRLDALRIRRDALLDESDRLMAVTWSGFAAAGAAAGA